MQYLQQVANELNYFRHIRVQYTQGTFSVRPARLKPILESIINGTEGKYLEMRMIEDDLYGVYEEGDKDRDYIFVGTEDEADEYIYQDMRERGILL